MRLLVIGEVDVVDPQVSKTRNLSLNTILNRYLNHFEGVLYFGPGMHSDFSNIREKGLCMASTSLYSKKIGNRLRYLMSSSIYRQLDAVMREYRPDWVQIRTPSIFSLKCAGYLLRNYDVKFTSYVAGDWEESLAGNYKKPGISYVAHLLAIWQDRILAQTKVVTAGDVLKQKLSERHACHAYYSTTHEEVFYHTVRERQILVVGRLEKLKRPHLAIEALKQLNEVADEPYQLCFLGDGPERDHLIEMCKTLGVESYVKFLGYVSDKEVIRDIYLSSRYLLHPSMTEGTSKVLAEAMAHGVIPIAIAGVGSNNFILKDGIGRLTSANAKEMTTEIIALENDKDLYSSTVQKGYAYALGHSLTNEVSRMWEWIKSDA